MGKFFSHLDLTLWPQISVVIFGLIFLGIVAWTFFLASPKRYQRGSELPLEED